MNTSYNDQINILLHQLYDEDDRIRLEAIHELGEIGDELCLKELRERLKYINQEHQALIIAVGKLKKQFGIK